MKRYFALCLPVLLYVLLSACSQEDSSALSDGNSTPPDPSDVHLAVVATVAADYSSGAHSLLTRKSTGEVVIQNNLKPTDSDISIATHGDYFYRIGRAYGGNSISKFALDDPQTVIWQYSVNDPAGTPAAAVTANPHDMVFASDELAYVLRYNKTTAWVVNPSADSEAGFKLGELDLSAYGGIDGIPDMDSAVIANGKLFIALQRLEGATYQPDNVSYLAVFDIATGREIDAGIPGDAFKGIPLQVRNPTDIFYDKTSDRIFVLGSGSTLPPLKYVGGIEAIDASSYRSQLILDDGDDAYHPYGLFYQMAMLPPDTLFFVGYEGWQNNTLYRLNLGNGQVSPTSVPQLINGDIADLAVDSAGRLWVGDSANAAIRFIDAATDSQITVISTGLNPAKIVLLP